MAGVFVFHTRQLDFIALYRLHAYIFLDLFGVSTRGELQRRYASASH